MKTERQHMAASARRDATLLRPGHTVAHVDDPELREGEVLEVWIEDRIRLARVRWARAGTLVSHAADLWRWA